MCSETSGKSIPGDGAASAKALSPRYVWEVSGTAKGPPVGLEQSEGVGGWGGMRGHNMQILVNHRRLLVFILSEMGSF